MLMFLLHTRFVQCHSKVLFLEMKTKRVVIINTPQGLYT